MKSILFFHNNNDYTGSTKVLADVIASEYSDQIVPVVVSRNRNKGFLSELNNVRFISFVRLTYKGKAIPILTLIFSSIQAFVISLFVGWKYQIFYINTIVPFYAALVGRLYRKQIVYCVHEKFVQRTIAKRIMECVFNHVTSHRIFVSYYTKNQYPVNLTCTEEVRYNKLGISFLSRVHVKPVFERKRNNVLMIASLSKMKGIFNFIQLARLVPECCFCLILSADMEAIKSFITEPVPGNVKLIPTQSDIHPYLFEADLMLNMSIPFFWIETFGMTILEAMAYGIPSIVPNVGGPTELIEDGYNGYCVDVTDVELMASKVRAALELEKYEQLCEGAFERFVKFK